jgi:hypothetical protein
LKDGALYSLHVTALNRALLASSHETNGVTVDTTPPQKPKVIYAHILLMVCFICFLYPYQKSFIWQKGHTYILKDILFASLLCIFVRVHTLINGFTNAVYFSRYCLVYKVHISFPRMQVLHFSRDIYEMFTMQLSPNVMAYIVRVYHLSTFSGTMIKFCQILILYIKK